MKIEDIIEANTAALIENTAVLREILAAASPAAATAVKKSRTKAEPLAVEPQVLFASADVNALDIADGERRHLVSDPEPEIEKPPGPEPTTEKESPEDHDNYVEPPTPEAPEPPEPSTSTVPDLPIPELRKVMKEKIKERIFADPAFDAQFKAARKKFGVEIIKDLADDQVAAFYAEVLA